MGPKTKAPSNLDIWTQIKTKQAELHALYLEVTQDIYKSTDGESFLGEKNVFFSQYWVGAVKKSRKAVTGEFDLDDFEVKVDLFPNLVEVYNGHNANSALLEAPYDALSKDILRYSTDAKKSFSLSNDPVCKQAVKDSPLLRKANNKKQEGEKPVEKAHAEKAGEPAAGS
jgi:hypothetical protein